MPRSCTTMALTARLWSRQFSALLASACAIYSTASVSSAAAAAVTRRCRGEL